MHVDVYFFQASKSTIFKVDNPFMFRTRIFRSVRTLFKCGAHFNISKLMLHFIKVYIIFPSFTFGEELNSLNLFYCIIL